MKTTTEVNTVNSLHHVIDSYGKRNYKIVISLDDDCKNGHNDFSITGSFWLANEPRVDKYSTVSGACHDEILKVRPDLKLFVDLHLGDVDGVPMYAIENGFYHLTQKEKYAQEYIRATDSEFEIIKTSEDKEVFQYYLESMGIVKRWKKEANQAIALLEKWTEQKFKDDSKRKPYKALTKDKRDKIVKRIKSGYYSIENIHKRADEKKKLDNENILIDLENEWFDAISKIDMKYKVQYAVASAGLPLNNFIFYDHTSEGIFNWLDYEKKISKEDLNAFLQSEHFHALKGLVTFKIKAG